MEIIRYVSKRDIENFNKEKKYNFIEALYLLLQYSELNKLEVKSDITKVNFNIPIKIIIPKDNK